MGRMSKYKIGNYKRSKNKINKYQHLANSKKSYQYYDIKSKNKTQKYNVEM